MSKEKESFHECLERLFGYDKHKGLNRVDLFKVLFDDQSKKIEALEKELKSARSIASDFQERYSHACSEIKAWEKFNAEKFELISRLEDKLDLSQKENESLQDQLKWSLKNEEQYKKELSESLSINSQIRSELDQKNELIGSLERMKTHYTPDEIEGLEQASEEHQEMIFKIEALEKEKESIVEYLESFIEFCDCGNPCADCICEDKNGWHNSKLFKLEEENKNLIATLKKTESLIYLLELRLDEDDEAVLAKIQELEDSPEYQAIKHLLVQCPED